MQSLFAFRDSGRKVGKSPFYNHNKAWLFPRKHKYPSCFLHWSGHQFPSPYGQKEHQTHGCCQAFPPCHLRCLHSLVFPHFSFPTAAGSNSALPSRVWSRFCTSITLATQSISFHPEHCCKYPRNSHPPSGKIQITESKSRFSWRESKASIGQ